VKIRVLELSFPFSARQRRQSGPAYSRPRPPQPDVAGQDLSGARCVTRSRLSPQRGILPQGPHVQEHSGPKRRRGQAGGGARRLWTRRQAAEVGGRSAVTGEKLMTGGRKQTSVVILCTKIGSGAIYQIKIIEARSAILTCLRIYFLLKI
jgi:hypothetical protein